MWHGHQGSRDEDWEKEGGEGMKSWEYKKQSKPEGKRVGLLGGADGPFSAWCPEYEVRPARWEVWCEDLSSSFSSFGNSVELVGEDWGTGSS